MDPSCLHSLQNDDETRALGALLDAFHPVFSLQEIASAYCRAGCDVCKASEILCQVQESDSTIVPHECDSEMNFAQSEKSLCGDNAEDSTLLCKNKGSKPKKLSASIGTVSSILGKAYARPTSSNKEPLGATKPLKLEVKGPLVNELEVEPVNLDSVPSKEYLSDKDIEEFLFSMLGDGFKLSRDVIREVLGHCGYNVKKGMEELLVLAAKTLEKGKAIDYDAVEKYTGKSPNSESCLPGENYRKFPRTQRNLTESASLDKERSNLPREVLLSLFNAPDRSEEEPIRKRLEWGLNRTRVVGQKVVTQPPDDIAFSTPTEVAKILSDIEHVVDEEDNYQILRRAVKEHWDEMKACYEAAVDAYSKGDRSVANFCLEQGRCHNQMAREADEKSARVILETRKSDKQSDVPLDLHTHNAKDAIRLLKKHIHSLANIPTFRYLKVIVNTDAEDITKGKRKRVIIKLLERESIKWTEEDGNPGTIFIQLNEIDPTRLSFANGLQ